MRDIIWRKLGRRKVEPKELARELGHIVVTEDVSPAFREALASLIARNEIEFDRNWKLVRNPNVKTVK
jgi:hypothetical protein